MSFDVGDGVPNGKCDSEAKCVAMLRALGQADERANTGIVMGIFPPHVIAIRCKTGRGRYTNLILRLCPWCGEQLAQGTAK